MNTLLILLIGGLALSAAVYVLFEFLHEVRTSLVRDGGPTAAASGHLRSLIDTQRKDGEEETSSRKRNKGQNLALAAAAETDLTAKKTETHARMTLEKKLRFSRCPLSPLQFRGLQAIATLLIFIPAYLHTTIFIQILILIMVPAVTGAMVNYAVDRRFKAFDCDYPVMLLQLVSILKTGMTAITAIEAVSKGLDEGSLVRKEIELLIDRLRLGLSEDQAISAFGEDIPHPELELFVQSLIIHRRVGGTLSATLERLSKQVRKRQQFRQQAVAAVAMERTSIYAIAAILTGLMFYMLYQSPDLVLPAFTDPGGIKIFQGGLALIVFGFYWSTTVTKIRI